VILCGLVVLVVRTAVASGDARAATADAKGPVVEVSVESGRLSVRAHEAPLAEVLRAVGRHAGVTMVLSGDLDTPVTETLTDVPVEEGIRRLSRWHSIVLIYGEPTGGVGEDVGLTEVWVVGVAGGLVGAGHRPSDVRGGDARAGAPRQLSSARNVESQERVDDGQDVVARERAVWAQVHEQGISAIADTLRAVATTDPSPRVRRAALMALTREPGVYGVKELREAVTTDPAPLVRRTAIWALASMRSAEAGDALRTVLNDPDPNIRAAATAAWAQWRKRFP
jgi:hypothetical protein